MNLKEYIASGVLELYVAGILSEKENREVYVAIQKHSEIKVEVENIEKAIGTLSESLSPKDIDVPFETIKNSIEKEKPKVIPIDSKKTKINWISYTGWAASVVLAGGLLWTINQNRELNAEIEVATFKNSVLEQKITDINTSLHKADELITILRDKNVKAIPLAGQKILPDAFAKVYVKEGETTVYIDALGLPTPPKGKVYQVWSLTLNPLTPTSIGLLSDFASDENKVFGLTNNNNSEAFGITLEPEGGSETPNLEQLYALGTVSP